MKVEGFCPSCGAHRAPAAAFCGSCGVRLTAAPQSSVEAVTKPVSPAASGAGVIFLIPVLATVLAPIGIGLHWWRSGHILATLILVWGLLIAGAIAQDRRRHVLAGTILIAAGWLSWEIWNS